LYFTIVLIVYQPHPLCPPSPSKERGIGYVREAPPLFDSPLVFTLSKRRKKTLDRASPLQDTLILGKVLRI